MLNATSNNDVQMPSTTLFDPTSEITPQFIEMTYNVGTSTDGGYFTNFTFNFSMSETIKLPSGLILAFEEGVFYSTEVKIIYPSTFNLIY